MTDAAEFARQVRRVSRGLARVEREQICCQDFTLQQFDTLRALHERQPQTTSELATRLGIDLSTASRNLAVLERDGYIRRERARKDARQVACRLAPKGSRCVTSLCCDERMVFATVLTRVPAAERDGVTRALAILADALEPAGATVCCAPSLQPTERLLPRGSGGANRVDAAVPKTAGRRRAP
jgi:DNA-binding MarR family transcriptional regulator